MQTPLIEALTKGPLSFHYSKGSAVIIKVVGLVSAASALFVFVSLVFQPLAKSEDVWPLLSVALVFAAGAVYCYLYMPRTKQVVTVSQESVTQAFPDKAPVTMRWDEVARLRERPFGHSLELVSSDSSRMMRIDKDIEGFSVLRDLIVFQIKVHSPRA